MVNPSIKRICVYCGANRGNSPEYAEAGRLLAQALVRQDIGLVYGGASRGIMGVVADQVLSLGGKVIGVLPESLNGVEIAHDGLTELHVVDSMHERKALMVELSDGFVALPGGIGTLEEIIETLTWAKLQFHAKPCGLLNSNGYFDHLLAFLAHTVAEGFMGQADRGMLLVDSDPVALLKRFHEYSETAGKKQTADKNQLKNQA